MRNPKLTKMKLLFTIIPLLLVLVERWLPGVETATQNGFNLLLLLLQGQ